MSDHTKEPWVIADKLGEVTGELTMIGGGKGKTGKPYALAGVFRFEESESDRKEAEANARRIVACVNACAGMSIEELEQIARDVAANGVDPVPLTPDRDPMETP